MIVAVRRYWRLLVIVLTPLILLPLPLLVPTIQSKCAYIVAVLTVYWVSEAVSYAVASFLPIALFPMFGVVPAEQIAYNYFKDATTLFVGSMLLAQAMECVQLHRRLALLVLNYVGSSMKWCMAGIMSVTAFVSLWVNNSAATSIMIPAALAIVEEIENFEKASQIHDKKMDQSITMEAADNSQLNSTNKISSLATPEELVHLNGQSNSQRTLGYNFRDLRTGFLISVAFSSAMGGLVTLVGTPSNIFLKGFMEETYDNRDRFKFEITFGNFFLYGLPMGMIMLIFTWVWLQIVYNRKEFLCWKTDAKAKETGTRLHLVFKQQYQNLPSLSWSEGLVLILFMFMIVLWLIRDFSREVWLIVFEKKYATDGTIALFVGSLAMILPNQNPFQTAWIYQPILSWNYVSDTFPWGVFMLQGAGLAIADGFKVSKLAKTMATYLGFLTGTSSWIVVLFVTIISAVFTEFSSNLAAASILFPILDSIARVTRIHPAHLLLPSCMAVSLSFMLPIATPPNAMIMEGGHVKIIELIKTGIIMKIFGILVIFIESILVIQHLFYIDNINVVYNLTRTMNATLS